MVEAYRKDIYYPQGIVRVGRGIVRIVDNSALDSYPQGIIKLVREIKTA